ncbi:MAG: transposase [Pseudomonadota bacterium]
MARLPTLCPTDIAVHIIHPGDNRSTCFACDEDHQARLSYLQEGPIAYGWKVHAWVFMTNQIHTLATLDRDDGISRMMQYAGRYFVRYFNSRYQRTGNLCDGGFKSCLVENDSYF